VEAVFTREAPAPAGHYAQGIVHGGLVYVSDASFWGRVNAVYARVMGDHRPARAIVPVKEFRGGWQIEIAAIAAVRPPA